MPGQGADGVALRRPHPSCARGRAEPGGRPRWDSADPRGEPQHGAAADPDGGRQRGDGCTTGRTVPTGRRTPTGRPMGRERRTAGSLMRMAPRARQPARGYCGRLADALSPGARGPRAVRGHRHAFCRARPARLGWLLADHAERLPMQARVALGRINHAVFAGDTAAIAEPVLAANNALTTNGAITTDGASQPAVPFRPTARSGSPSGRHGTVPGCGQARPDQPARRPGRHEPGGRIRGKRLTGGSGSARRLGWSAASTARRSTCAMNSPTTACSSPTATRASERRG